VQNDSSDLGAHPLDQIVELVAPRSWGDFLLKLVLIQALLAGLYICKEVMLGMELAHMTFPDVRPVFVLGLPFICFSLSIMWHQRTLHERLADLAVTDVLTNLANRRGFLHSVSDGEAFAKGGILLLLDVDHFKQVNDKFGHCVGDQCLVAVARRLQSLARVEDCVGRYGGEEFVMFLNGAATRHLDSIHDRLTMVPWPFGRATALLRRWPKRITQCTKPRTQAERACFEAVGWPPRIAPPECVPEAILRAHGSTVI